MLKILLIILGILAIGVLTSSSVYADSTEHLTLRAKGVLVGDEITGGRIWLSISDGKALEIFQWDLGRVIIRYDMIPSSDCEPNYPICLVGTVTYTHNAAANEVGDLVIFKIDPVNKELVVDPKGKLLNDITFFAHLTKIYKNSLNSEITQTTNTKTYDVPTDLPSVTISGKLKSYTPPLNAPQSETEPEYVLITDKDYPELSGAIQIALYNVDTLPENLEHVQVTGYFNPQNPDWYYPEQEQRVQQVIFVEQIIQLDPIDLGNEYTTQQLRERYDEIHLQFQSTKEQFMVDEITQEQYLSTLEGLVQNELQLYEDVKNHTFGRDEMTDYNFWHRGVMKFPTIIEQEISRMLEE